LHPHKYPCASLKLCDTYYPCFVAIVTVAVRSSCKRIPSPGMLRVKEATSYLIDLSTLTVSEVRDFTLIPLRLD